MPKLLENEEQQSLTETSQPLMDINSEIQGRSAKMRKIICFLLMALTVQTGSVVIGNAGETGGKLKIDDNKQELKKTMNQIKEITTISHNYIDNMPRTLRQSLVFSGCKIKTDFTMFNNGNGGFGNYEFSLGDIDDIEIISEGDTLAAAELKTINFEKKVFFYNNYRDTAEIYIPKNNSSELKDLLLKAIKLCQEK